MPDFARVRTVEEITYITGVGPYTLAGATTGHFRFRDSYPAGATIPYKVTDGPNVEIVQGVFDGVNTLTRNMIFGSSNRGLPVNWTGKTRPLVWPLVNRSLASLAATIPNLTLNATGTVTFKQPTVGI